MVYVAAYLGLRWEEVSALKPSNLELPSSVARQHVLGTLPVRTAGYRPYGKTGQGASDTEDPCLPPRGTRLAKPLPGKTGSGLRWI